MVKLQILIILNSSIAGFVKGMKITKLAYLLDRPSSIYSTFFLYLTEPLNTFNLHLDERDCYQRTMT